MSPLRALRPRRVASSSSRSDGVVCPARRGESASPAPESARCPAPYCCTRISTARNFMRLAGSRGWRLDPPMRSPVPRGTPNAPPTQPGYAVGFSPRTRRMRWLCRNKQRQQRKVGGRERKRLTVMVKTCRSKTIGLAGCCGATRAYWADTSTSCSHKGPRWGPAEYSLPYLQAGRRRGYRDTSESGSGLRPPSSTVWSL